MVLTVVPAENRDGWQVELVWDDGQRHCVRDLLLSSAGAEVRYSNGFSLAAWADGEFAQQYQRYSVNGRVRYSF